MKLRSGIVVVAFAVASCAPGAPAPGPQSCSPSAPCTPGASTASSSATTPEPSAAPVVVFFGRSDLDPCEQLVPVVRFVAAATPEAALRTLLEGPTEAERAAGYLSIFSTVTADSLISIDVRDGTARVSFRDLRPIIPAASSSCGSGMLLASLDATLLQFPGIRAARYSFGGDEAAFYEWLQRDVPAE